MKSVGAICLIWGLVSLGIYGAGRVLPEEAFWWFEYVSIGAWLAGHLKRPPEIVALGVTAGLADLFSVFKGPTKLLSESIYSYYAGGMKGLPPLVDFIMIKLPMPGHSLFMPVFGVTDWVLPFFLRPPINSIWGIISSPRPGPWR